jgi:nucleotide-binding universal stress UspA family protein
MSKRMPAGRKPQAGRVRGQAAKQPAAAILIPLDGAETSASILVYGIELARALNARIVLLTVVADGASDDERASAGRYLEAIGQGLDHRGVAHETKVETGDFAGQIASVTAAESCELIVMTPHAHPGAEPTLLGGTADRVIRSTAVPVMLVRPEHVRATLSYWANPPPFLVGLDGSVLAATALVYASGFARRLGSELVLLRAIQPALPLGGAASYYQSPSDIALNYLREVADGVRQSGLKVTCQVLLGPADTEIIKAANGLERAVIALCTRGYSGRKEWVLGSVTDRVVRSTMHPVLVIPPSAAR